jgi:hypothetical protein
MKLSVMVKNPPATTELLSEICVNTSAMSMSSEIRAVTALSTIELSNEIGAITNESHVTELAVEIDGAANS